MTQPIFNHSESWCVMSVTYHIHNHISQLSDKTLTIALGRFNSFSCTLTMLEERFGAEWPSRELRIFIRLDISELYPQPAVHHKYHKNSNIKLTIERTLTKIPIKQKNKVQATIAFAGTQQNTQQRCSLATRGGQILV